MQITYDPEADVLYIRLVEGKYECRTLLLNETVALNISQAGLLVGIEILEAKETLRKGDLPAVVLENVPCIVAESSAAIIS